MKSAPLFAAFLFLGSLAFSDDDPLPIGMNPDGVEYPKVFVDVAYGSDGVTGTNNVYLRAEYRGFDANDPSKVGVYYFRVRTDLGIDTNGDKMDWKDIKYANIEFTYLNDLIGDSSFPSGWQNRVATLSVSRDQRLDIEWSSEFSYVDTQAGIFIPPTEAGSLSGSVIVAIEALGAKVIRYMGEGNKTFYGFKAFSIGGEISAGVGLGEKFIVRLALGGAFELSRGGSTIGKGISLQSWQTQSQGHVEARVDYTDFGEFYFRFQGALNNDRANQERHEVYGWTTGVRIYIP